MSRNNRSIVLPSDSIAGGRQGIGRALTCRASTRTRKGLLLDQSAPDSLAGDLRDRHGNHEGRTVEDLLDIGLGAE